MLSCSKLKHSSFTIIELAIVLLIITILVPIIGISVQNVRRDIDRSMSITMVKGLIRTAHSRSRRVNDAYGLLVYVNPKTSKQTIFNIEPKARPDRSKGEKRPDVCDRYQTVSSKKYELAPQLRLAQISSLGWNDERRLNDNYRNVNPSYGQAEYEAGTFHRNFFVILFLSGKIYHPKSIIIHDKDDDTGFGLNTGLAVGDITAEHGSSLKNIAVDQENNPLEWIMQDKFLFYDEEEYSVLSDEQKLSFFDSQSYLVIHAEARISQISPG